MPHLKHRDAVVDLPSGKTLTIGRLPECDLVIPAAIVSRRHAQVVEKNGHWQIVDLGSQHGTFVNRLRVTEKLLEADDQIRIGGDLIVFSDKPAPAPKKKVAGAVAIARADLPPPDPRRAPELTDGSLEMTDPTNAIPPAVVDKRKVDEGTMVKAAISAQGLDLGTLHEESPKKGGGGRSTSQSQLLALVRISDGIHRCPDVASVCRTAVEMAMRATGADRGAMAVRDEAKRDFVQIAQLHRVGPQFVDGEVQVSRTFVREVMRERVAMFAQDTGSDEKLSMAKSIVAMAIRSILGAPLWDGDRILGYLYLDSTGTGRRFSPRDLDLISVIGYQAGAAISRMKLVDKAREAEARRQNYARFLPRDVIRLVEEQGGKVDPSVAQQQTATVLFSDIQGFTSLGEDMEPAALKAFLDDYFERMTEILVDRCGGTLDKYIGDGIMALFGAPFSPKGEQDDALRAVEASVLMREEMDALRKAHPAHGATQIRIGINTGKVTAGFMGSRRRIEYTVIGDAVNVASRLESTSEAGKIQIGESTWVKVKDRYQCVAAGERQVKNRTKPVQCWYVVGPKK